MSGHIVQINISATGGVPKKPVAVAQVTIDGITGNAVAHPKVHGGPDRALCLYSQEHILVLQKAGHPIRPGSVGENVTIAGLDWAGLGPGAKLRLGEHVSIEIASYAGPCDLITGSFADRDSRRISQKKYPGWSRLYARVLTPGTIRSGDAVRVLPGPSSDD